MYLRPIVRLPWPSFWLSGAIDRARSATRLYRTNCRLAWPIDFAWSAAGLAWAIDLARATARVGPRNTRLCGDRARSRTDRRSTLVHVIELLPVLCGLALILNLRRHRRNARSTHRGDFGGLWADSDAASPPVIRNPRIVVDNNGPVVDVADIAVDPINRAVVVEIVAVPIPAMIAEAGVAEAIVNTTIEADMQAPEAAMEAPAVVIPAPVTRRPKRAVIGRSAPGARNPVVSCRTPIPISRSPDVVRGRRNRLIVDRQRRRRLVGILHWLALALFVELVIRLSILVGLILIGGRRRSGLLRRSLRTVHLRAMLGLSLCWSSGRLALIDWSHIHICGICT